MTSPPDVLVGRERELEAVRRTFTTVRDHGSVVVLHGDPGIGKSALTDAATAQARWLGLDVVRVAGAPSEAEVPLAVLHQLVHSLRHRVPDLPAPQRAALGAVLGEEDVPQPNVFLVALAVLTLLSEQATRAGLLLVVEDLHCVDDATLRVLAFVARRLGTEPVVLLVSSRFAELTTEIASALPDAVVLDLQPLGRSDAQALLSAQPQAPAGALAERVLRLAQGNPLAVIELGTSTREHGLRRDGRLPLTDRLVRAFADRVRTLGDEQRTLLLTAAVGAGPQQAAVLAASSRMLGRDVEPAVLDGLLATRLVSRTRGAVEFRHPLVASAVLEAADPRERAQAHRAVAELLPPGTDRRVWHLAVVAEEADADLAAELAASAARLRDAGDPRAAVGAFKRSAELSPDPEDRANRLFQAAQMALVVQSSDESAALAQEVAGLTQDRELLARVRFLQALHPGGAVQRGDAGMALVIADELFDAGSREHAVTALVRMALQYWSFRPEGEAWEQMIGRLRHYGLADTDPRLLWMRAFGTPGPASAQVREVVASIDPEQLDDPDLLRLLGMALSMAGALDGVDAFLERSLVLLRRSGRLADLPLALMTAIGQRTFAGELRAAAVLADEAESYAADLNEPLTALTTHLFGLMAHAATGEDVDEGSAARAFPELAPALRVNPLRMWHLVGVGIAHAAHGRHEQAYDAFGELVLPDSPYRHWGWGERDVLPHFADAAARCGRQEQAARVLEPVEGRAGMAESPLMRSVIAFSRAVLGVDEDRDAAFRRAVDPGVNRLPWWRARALLAYGEWLRRGRRAVEAREVLRQARDELDRAGSVAWADTARAELAAAGESSPRPRARAGGSLTPQEERIALLAAQGLSNREIAARLFLSSRTVGAHLHAAYRKLEVGGRGELSRALRDD